MGLIEQKAVVDRIEDGTHAVLLVGEAEVERVIPVEHLPVGAQPGSWLRIHVEEDKITQIVLDTEGTEAAQARIESKMDVLRQRKRHFQPIDDDESGGPEPK